MNKLKTILLIVTFGVIIFSPVLVYAQPATSIATTPTGLPEYSGVDSSISDYLCTPTGDGKDLERCINRLYRFGITAGAIILVAMVVFAGYLYITSGETGKGKAKSMLMNSLVGMAMLLGSYALLYFINPSLVAFRAIQPPIFSVADLPECEAIGLGEDCIVVEDSASVTSAKGGYADCPDGVINFDKSAVPVNGGGDTEKVCKALMEKLKLIHAQQKITVTATIGPGHDSNCHKPGNSKSGVCADMAPQNGNYEDLCSVISSVGGLAVLNESGKTGPKCGTFVKTRQWTGAHLHVWLTTGTGTGDGKTEGGSRPNCIAVKNTPGVCDDGLSSGTKYKDGDFDNADPQLKTAFLALQKKYPSIQEKQVYRSPQYGAHMRSAFEAYAYNAGWSQSEISGYGQYCKKLGILYVTPTDAKNANTISFGTTHMHHFTDPKVESPMTCYSDHGRGLAVDIPNAPQTKAFEQAAKSVGLCHTVPQFTAHGHTTRKDHPHYALYSKLPGGESNCVNYY